MSQNRLSAAYDPLDIARSTFVDLVNALDLARESNLITERGADALTDVLEQIEQLSATFDELFADEGEDRAYWRYWHARIDVARGK
jgi:hypothetical protein